jgi:perosamine synthetase
VIPRIRPALGWAEVAAALHWPGADDVARYERAFAASMGQRHALAFAYGRAALTIALRALLGGGREVICPAYTCVVVAHAIVSSGNIPIFIDCGAEDFNMDLAAVEAAITPRTGAIIATSLFGHAVNLDRTDALRAAHPGVLMIQDCAHSFDAAWRGRAVQGAGDFAIFGLNISKLLTSIFGGMLTTDDERVANVIRAARDRELARASLSKGLRRAAYFAAILPAFLPSAYALVARLKDFGLLDRFVRYYRPDVVDMPSDYLQAMNPIEARVGRAQLRRHRAILAARRRRAARWHARLTDEPGLLRLPALEEGATWSHFSCVVDDRDAWVARWRARGIELGILIEYSIPELPAYGGHSPQRFPHAARYARHTVNFPLTSDLPDV